MFCVVVVAPFELDRLLHVVVHEAVPRLMVQVLGPLVLVHAVEGLHVAHPELQVGHVPLRLHDVQNGPGRNITLLKFFFCFISCAVLALKVVYVSGTLLQNNINKTVCKSFVESVPN